MQNLLNYRISISVEVCRLYVVIAWHDLDQDVSFSFHLFLANADKYGCLTRPISICNI